MSKATKDHRKAGEADRPRSYGRKADSSYRLIFDAFLLFLFNRSKFFSKVNDYLGQEFGDRGKSIAIAIALAGLAGGILVGFGFLLLALIVVLIDCLLDNLAASIAITLFLSLLLTAAVLWFAFLKIKSAVRPLPALEYGKRSRRDRN